MASPSACRQRAHPAGLLLMLAALLAACETRLTEPPPTGSPLQLTIVPAAVTLLPGGEQDFTASLPGNPAAQVELLLPGGASTGTLTADGVYHAPAAPGSYMVRARLIADTAVQATGVVTVVAYTGVGERLADPARAYDHHTVTRLRDGSALLIGAFDEEGLLADTERFLPATGAFAPGPSLSHARMGHAAALLPDGHVLVTGGWNVMNGQSPFDTAFSSTEVYDPATEQFAPGPHLREPRRNHLMTPLGDGRVLVSGGIRLRGNGFGSLARLELYDPTTGVFEEAGVMQDYRWEHTATALADGRVLIVGGRPNNCTISAPCASPSHASAEIYDPATGTVQPTGSLSVPRHAHLAAALPDGRVAVFGGWRYWFDGNAAFITEVEIYDPGTGQFSPGGSTLHPRAHGAAVLLGDGRVLLVGGTNHNEYPLSTTELFTPGAGSVPGPLMSDLRIRPAAVRLRGGQVLVVGGNNSGTAVVRADLIR